MRLAWLGVATGGAILAGVALLATAPPPQRAAAAGSLAGLDPAPRVALLAPRERSRERHRPARSVPRVRARSARIGALRRRAGRVPVRLRVPALGLNAPIGRAGVRRRVLALPRDVRRVAWYRHGARPGEPGTALLAAHADYDGRPAAFLRLSRLEPGHRIEVRMRTGGVRRFRVVARRRYGKDDLPARLFRMHGPRLLALVTCGGRFDERTRTYESNTVVYALATHGAGKGRRSDGRRGG